MLQDHFRDTPNNLCPSCVKEWDSWLGEVSDVRERKRITSDLKKVGSTEFHSSHLELYFHHFFSNKGFKITWHPTLQGVGKHPEYLLQRNGESILFEARISKQENTFREQEEFCTLLKREIEQLHIPLFISFFTDQNAPPLSIFDQIKTEIIDYVSNQAQTAIERKETTGRSYKRFKFRGSTYGINFMFNDIPDDMASQDSLVMYSVGGWSSIDRKLFHDIELKASRYGIQDIPFVIGIRSLDAPSSTDEIHALYGHQTLVVTSNSEGKLVDTKEEFKLDGLYFYNLSGKPIYSNVSAIAFYQYQRNEEHHGHGLRIYHNPNATYPLDTFVFSEAAQYSPFEDKNHDVTMQWIPQQTDFPL